MTWDAKSYAKTYYIRNKEAIKARVSARRAALSLEIRKEQRTYRETHSEYLIYGHMKRRCSDPKDNSYRYYGARGIAVKYKSFYEFLSDVGIRPGRLYSIDRIDNNRHYERGNCRWATAKQQANNRRA